MKIGCVIPAHLKSVRFPRKILFFIKGLEMVEHVRRRALLCKSLNQNVYVATGDKKILNLVKKNNGKVIKTYNQHLNGTSRVAEAIKYTDLTHVIILQGDEPLIYPEYLDSFVKTIKKDKKVDCWNLIAPIKHINDLNKKSFVKGIIDKNNYIIELDRKINSKKINQAYKILGLIALKRKALLKIVKTKPSINEKYKFIEQLRIIENRMTLKGVRVRHALPSINEKKDLKKVLYELKKNKKQIKIFKKILK